MIKQIHLTLLLLVIELIVVGRLLVAAIDLALAIAATLLGALVESVLASHLCLLALPATL